MMDAGMEKTLAQYINENMDNLEEEFNNKLYERILKEYIHQLSENRVINTDYFIGHADPDIRNLAIELSTSPLITVIIGLIVGRWSFKLKNLQMRIMSMIAIKVF